MKSEKPEISVIIPVHNSQMHLEECLASLKVQSFSDFEVLIINNGSTDNSQAIAESFSRCDDRFILINHNHGMAGEARNIGLVNARGSYIAFVDSDDTVREQYLEKLYSAITQHHADVAVCGYCIYFRKSDKIVQRHTVKNKIYEKNEAMKELLRDKKMRFYLWNKLWKHTLFTDNGINIPDMYYEDAVACSRLFCHAEKVVMTDYCGYSYVRASSKIYTEIEMNGIRINDYINTVPMIRNYLEDKGIYKSVKTPFTRHIFHVFFSVPLLVGQAHDDLERGWLKNSLSGMGKVLKACSNSTDQLEELTKEKAVL